MRPVNKGKSPYKTIGKYQDALPYLEERIGLYCSYCEMPISHVPEVEHMISKKRGGEWTEWDNLLLGCKYCNARKSKKTTPQNVGNYLWPDTNNTAVAFSYVNGIPTVNEKVLKELDATETFYKKAKNTYEMVGLGHLPDGKKGDKDRRLLSRNVSYYKALKSLENWEHVKDAQEPYKSDMKEQIVMTAMGDGFFSVWMTVFKDEPQIRLALIEHFIGTNRKCYDECGRVRKILF